MFDEKQKEVEEQDEAGWCSVPKEAQGCSSRDSAARARARERERQIQRGYHVYRVHERACTYICARARKRARRSIGEREEDGAEEEKERERSANSRVRPCGRHREESEKERKKRDTSGIEGEKKEREREKEQRGEIFVRGACVSYVRVYAKMKETGEKRDETSSA